MTLPPAPSLPGSTHPLTHGGESLLLMPDRASFWPAHSTLLVADLHLGKAEAMRTHGIAVPTSVGDESLDRLARIISQTQARRVIILGDLLHAPAGITTDLTTRVAAWRNSIDAPHQIDLCLVPGNHDRAVARVADAWRLRILSPAHSEGPLTLTHEPPAPESPGAFVSGHIHPAISLPRGRGPSKVACFHLAGSTLILPAFSRFTGGVPVQRTRTQTHRLFAITDEGVLEV